MRGGGRRTVPVAALMSADSDEVHVGGDSAAKGVEHGHEGVDRTSGAPVIHELARHDGPGIGVDQDRKLTRRQNAACIGVKAVHDRDECLVRPRDREEEPGLLED